ncbi:FKBP-type peptidyl-prolyl cis-trans isomerase [Dysgonomonas sp. 25]|uniref:FKBP-type peptidyl-prolyl cis-trans isomerase n=1 Tax=Dysgonomonas sp. 25 TaxID=2302933 RepID=UPI0013CF5A0A|nr:FKBP-type peptidyl-prolyl cis-trans isomerase [Dysgonomonas sp. 25]NDV69162.1 FKBP-type peptidyl-prolyl cis-trans isomerase [Dysgonomonas sp. 25]
MKKLCIFSLGVLISAGALFTSCENAVSTRPSLATESDSLSYAYGVNLYESGLGDYLKRAGIVADTNAVKSPYLYKIANEKDEAAKAKLQKQMEAAVDSAQIAGRKNVAEFIRGLHEGLDDNKAKEPYVQGVAIGKQIADQMLPRLEDQLFEGTPEGKLSRELIASGVATGMTHAKPAMPNAPIYMNSKMDKLQKAQAAKREAEEAERQAQAVKRAEEEKVFLAENAKKSGVVTLPSGLQYKVLTQGNGAKPKSTDRVSVLYKGTLLDGSVFDSAENADNPATFGVTQVIKGWTEALQLMPEGSKWELYIPSELAYGSHGNARIPGNSTLIFEIELLKIN